jgi:SAM-dependent methyltransferase
LKINKKESKEWWKTFFRDPWRDVFVQKEILLKTREEADFIQKILALKNREKILDVPCGEGRHSIELAKRKFKITGVDSNKQFLDIARRRSEEKRLKIIWDYRDMRDLPWREEFDAAFSFWGSFGYFDDKGNADFLKAVSLVLKPGGKFLLDTHVEETLLQKIHPERISSQVGETLILEEKSYDCSARRVNTEWTFIHYGKKIRRLSSIRLYTYKELCDLLHSVGFGGFRGYGSLNGKRFFFGSPRLYLVAVKKTK